MEGDRSEIVILNNMNPNLAYMPNWLLNFGVKKAIPHMIAKFTDPAIILKNEKLTKRIEEKKEFYDMIKRRVNDL